MLSSILKSKRAIQVNIQIMRVFAKLRQIMLDNGELRNELAEMKRQTDSRSQIVFETLDQLVDLEEKPRKKIGFEVKEGWVKYGRKYKMAN
jgi:hypothetical protein